MVEGGEAGGSSGARADLRQHFRGHAYIIPTSLSKPFFPARILSLAAPAFHDFSPLSLHPESRAATRLQSLVPGWPRGWWRCRGGGGGGGLSWRGGPGEGAAHSGNGKNLLSSPFVSGGSPGQTQTLTRGEKAGTHADKRHRDPDGLGNRRRGEALVSGWDLAQNTCNLRA